MSQLLVSTVSLFCVNPVYDPRIRNKMIKRRSSTREQHQVNMDAVLGFKPIRVIRLMI